MIPGLVFMGEVSLLALELTGNVLTASVDFGDGLTGDVTATRQPNGTLVCWGSWAGGELGSYLSELAPPELAHMKRRILAAMSDASRL